MSEQVQTAGDGRTAGKRHRRARRPLPLWQRIPCSLLVLVAVLGAVELGLRLVGVQGAPDRTTTWFADHILRPPLWFEREMEELLEYDNKDDQEAENEDDIPELAEILDEDCD